jgi:hypothetical protein
MNDVRRKRKTVRYKQCLISNKDLLMNRVYHKWIDMNGQTKNAYGIVTNWYGRSQECNSFYVVSFYPTEEIMIKEWKRMNLEQTTHDTSDTTNEIVHSSYINYDEMITKSLVNNYCINKHTKQIKHCLKWMTPDKYQRRTIKHNGLSVPVLIVHVSEVKLIFFVAPSRDVGGGLGLFVYQSPSPNTMTGHNFQIPPGTLIDVGVFGPFDQSHRKSEHVMMLKNFIHDWNCESWQFEASLDYRDQNLPYIDVTNDYTGEPPEKLNLLGYVNEAMRSERATLTAQLTPDGCIHYYIGSDDIENSISISIPSGFEHAIELKTHYGPGYEKVRLRNNYSGASKKRRTQLRKEINNDDSDAIKIMTLYSIHQIKDLWSFLKKFRDYHQKRNIISKKTQCRLFISSLVLWNTAFSLLQNNQQKQQQLQKQQELAECTNLQNELKWITSILDEAKYVTYWWPHNSPRCPDNYKMDILLQSTLFLRTMQSIINLPFPIDRSALYDKMTRDFMLRRLIELDRNRRFVE